VLSITEIFTLGIESAAVPVTPLVVSIGVASVLVVELLLQEEQTKAVANDITIIDFIDLIVWLKIFVKREIRLYSCNNQESRHLLQSNHLDG
jgi:hypothetical protein